MSPCQQGVDAAYKSRVNFPPGVNVAQPSQAVWAASHLLQPVSGSQPRAEPLQTQAQTRSTMSLIIDSVIFAQVPIVLARILDMGNDFPRKC